MMGMLFLLIFLRRRINNKSSKVIVGFILRFNGFKNLSAQSNLEDAPAHMITTPTNILKNGTFIQLYLFSSFLF